MQKLFKGIILVVLSLNLILVCVNIALVLLKTPETYKIQGLFLSQLIKQGHLDEARKLAKVQHPKFFSVESYSGYLTVNEVTNAHLFFWYFPAAKSPIQAPVILLLSGGGGSSSLHRLFLEIGPFYLVSATELQLRKHSWHKQYNLVFIDNPLGAGFSKTDGKLAQNATESARDLYAAMMQFFAIFPELVSNEFYICGESYAAKYTIALGRIIHINNPNVKEKINLKGLIIGNGFVDPINQINYDDYLYQLGMCDERESELFRVEQNKCIELIANQSYEEAWKAFTEIIYDYPEINPYGTLFANFSGSISVYNYLKSDDFEPAEQYIEQFMNQEDVKHAIHVDGDDFHLNNPLIFSAFRDDIMRSVIKWLSELLSHYRVLLFAGQVDVVVGFSLMHNFITKMNFSGNEAFRNATREKWHVGEELAGYFKTGGNLSEVMVRKAGHFVLKDQPFVAMDMVDRFINNKSFD